MIDFFHWISIIVNFLQLPWTGGLSYCDKCDFTVAAVSNQTLHEIHNSHAAEQLKAIFDKVNVIRVVDTKQHQKVGQFISDYFDSLTWTVEWDNFTTETVIGRKTFRNIIATLGSTEDNLLVLSCHYDSKKMEGFYGSTDSAMPCSIMLRIATVITPLYRLQLRPNLALRMIFFDGEEAFKDWTEEDSLYGSRHLAAKWNQADSEGKRELSKIKLFILLDLIGSRGITIPSYPKGKNEIYSELVTLEKRLANQGLLNAYRNNGHRYFGTQFGHRVEDDHVPFLSLGVPVLHLIPIPFPAVWHTVYDNAANIDWDASMDFLRLIDALVRSILHLDVYGPESNL